MLSVRQHILYSMADSGDSDCNTKKFNEKKGADGLWQSRVCVPSALLLNALNFALNFFLFDTAFSNILCQHYRTNNARMLIPSN